tara:strand:- start:306 stop:518 length:213 start_codon:yes stop_codon:yes gene_type:complete
MLNDKVKEDIIEVTCDSCQSDYEIRYNEEKDGEPIYCPFCGADIDYEEDDNESEDFDEDDDSITGYGGTH